VTHSQPFHTIRHRSDLNLDERWPNLDGLYLGTEPDGIGKLEAHHLTKDWLSLFSLGSLSQEIANVKKILLAGRVR
jgi:hypothetical protein